MNGRVMVKDTADVYYHFANGDTRYFGCMNTSSLELTRDTEDIRCGIGFGIATIMFTNPDMTLTLTPAFWNDFFIEDAFGSEFSEGASADLWKTEKVEFTIATADATATINGTPLNDVVKVQDRQGKLRVATFTGSTVTVTGGADLDGLILPVSYQETTTGDVLDLDVENIPKVHGITLATIAYDPDTNEVLSDLQWYFPKVLGDGNLSLALQGATNSVTEINAKVLPEAGSFGQYTVADRA